MIKEKLSRIRMALDCYSNTFRPKRCAIRRSILAVLILFPGVGCKLSESDVKVGVPKKISAEAKGHPMDRIAMLRPIADASATMGHDPGELRPVLEQYRVELGSARRIVRRLPNGERVLLIDDGVDFVPIVSHHEGKVFVWEIVTQVQYVDGRLRMRTSNMAYKRPIDSDFNSPEAVPYLLYKNPEGAEKGPLLVPVTEHVTHAGGILRRDGNRYYNAKAELQFWFHQLTPKVWRVRGNFYNGFTCNGSIIVDVGDSMISATREFGRLGFTRWRPDAHVMRYAGEAKPEEFPESLKGEVQACPFNTEAEIEKTIADAKFRNDFSEPSDDPTIRELDWNAKYRIGDRVNYDGAVWYVLEAMPFEKQLVVLNHSRTKDDDDGKIHRRVYMIERSSWRGYRNNIRLLGSTDDYLAHLGARIHSLSDERIAQEKTIVRFRKVADEMLALAEVKANMVGATSYGRGFKATEAMKPVVNIITNAADELIFSKVVANARGVKGRLKGYLGIKTHGGGLVGAVTAGKELTLQAFRSRFSAALFVTLVQGARESLRAVMVNLDKGLAENAESAGWITAQTGAVWGLRSVFPLNTATKIASASGALGVLFHGASGFAMRWRKLQIDEKLGYDNERNGLNLAFGSAQAVAQGLAIPLGNGVNKAIGYSGMLVSEMVAGRGNPYLIAGSAVEIGAALLPWPLLRPVAMTAAGQISALIQIQGALSAGYRVSQAMDHVRYMMQEQIGKYNSAVFLVKTYPELLDSLSSQELNLLLSTLKDPFSYLRQQKQR